MSQGMRLLCPLTSILASVTCFVCLIVLFVTFDCAFLLLCGLLTLRFNLFMFLFDLLASAWLWRLVSVAEAVLFDLKFYFKLSFWYFGDILVSSYFDAMIIL